MSEDTQINISTTTEIVNVDVTETLQPVSLECYFAQSSASDTVIDITESIQNIELNVTEIEAQNVEIDFSYPVGPQGIQGPQGTTGPPGSSIWGTISGTLSAQTDLWRYLSAVGTSNFDIPTLTNYLSTNNVLLSGITVTTNISAQGLIYSRSLTPNLPVPKIKLAKWGLSGPNIGPYNLTQVRYLSGTFGSWSVGGNLSFLNVPYLLVSDFTQEDLNNYQIFIEMVMFKKTKTKNTILMPKKVNNLSFTIPVGNAVKPWGNNFWQRSGDVAGSLDNPKTVVTRYNHLPVNTLNDLIPLYPCLNGHFRERTIEYLDPTSTINGDFKGLNCIVPFGSYKIFSNVNRWTFAYSRNYKPLYIAFRYICWLPNNNNGKGQIISGPLSQTIRVANLYFPFDTDHYQSSLKGFPVVNLNPAFDKEQFICNFC